MRGPLIRSSGTPTSRNIPWHRHRADWERVRDTLEPVAFAVAEEVGRTLTVEDAVTEALVTVEHLATASPALVGAQDAGVSEQSQVQAS